MANLAEAMGYNLGKSHVGFLAYMCDLHREGIPAPLEAFLQTLSISVPHKPVPVREWKTRGGRLDLAIFDGQAEEPSIIIEMKVDDYERPDQLQGYVEATGLLSQGHRLLVTLGNGEYYRGRDPQDGFTWIRLARFTRAVTEACSMVHGTEVLGDWRDALNHELKRRECVKCNHRREISTYRAGSWNITLLGKLREELPEAFCNEIGIDTTCYTWGQRPDTILNFGWWESNLYAEINNNGKLNVKIRFGSPDRHTECRGLLEFNQQSLVDALPEAEKPKTGYHCGWKTATLASLPIGLGLCEDGALGYTHGSGHTIKRCQGTPRFAQLGDT